MLCDVSLKWNNHCSTFMGQLSTLHKKQKFCDSTIAGNGKNYHVHRVVLASCSDYFADMLEDTFVNMHPILVLTDVSNDVIEALLKYMYLGEVCVNQETFPDLLSAAKSFKIKGLATSDKLPVKNEALNNNSFYSETNEDSSKNTGYDTITGNNDIGSQTKLTEQHVISPELQRTYSQNVSAHETFGDVAPARKVFGKARRGKLFSRIGKRTFSESNNDKLDSPSNKKFDLGTGRIMDISDQPSLVINRVALPLKAHYKLAEPSAVLEAYDPKKNPKEQEDHWLPSGQSQTANESVLSLETDDEMMPIITDCYSLQCTEQQQSSAIGLEEPSNQLISGKSWHLNSKTELLCGEDAACRDNATAFNKSLLGASAKQKLVLKKDSVNDVCWSIVPENVSDQVSAQVNVMSRDEFSSGKKGISTDNYNPNYNQCPFCLFLFRDNTQLRGHIEVKHPDAKQFPCSLCTVVYFDEVTLNHHTVNRHSSLPPIKEKSASEKINETIDKVISKGELKISDKCKPKHSSLIVKLNKIKNGQNKFTSGKLKFNSVNESARIFKRHRCPYCEHTNKVKTNLVSHMRRHFEKKKYCCKLCSYSTCYEIALLRHSNNDHNTSKYTSHEQSVVSHTSKYYKQITNRGESEQFSCLACSFLTERELCMLEHIQVHIDCQKCSYCDFKSYTLCGKTYHEKRSSGVALYTCKHCGYKACFEKQLNSHLYSRQPMKTYIAKYGPLESNVDPVETPNVNVKKTVTRPLKCSRCSFSASEKQCMLKHLHDHSIGTSNKCSRCDYKTNLVANLMRHQKLESKLLYRCKNCDFKTCFRFGLVRHQKWTARLRWPCKKENAQKFASNISDNKCIGLTRNIVKVNEFVVPSIAGTKEASGCTKLPSAVRLAALKDCRESVSSSASSYETCVNDNKAVTEHFSKEVTSATQADFFTLSEQDALQQHESLLNVPLCKQEDNSCRGAHLIAGSTPAQMAGARDSLDILDDASSECELGHLSLKKTGGANIIGIERGSCGSATGASINVVPRESGEKCSVRRGKLSDDEDGGVYGDLSSKCHDGGLVRPVIVQDKCATNAAGDGVLLHDTNVRNDMQTNDHTEENFLYGDVNTIFCDDGSSGALENGTKTGSQNSDIEDEFLYGEINAEQNT